MLKKLYDKSQIGFAVSWIVAYCVLFSFADAFSLKIGVEKSLTVLMGGVMCLVLLAFLKKNSLFDSYGLCLAKLPAKKMLYYVPVLLMLTANFWCGVTVNRGGLETTLYILSMFCVGFLEEVIFRGLLFEAMRKNNEKSAVIVSSITFGVGHIVNLFNGSSTELLENLLQIFYATAVGFMFVMIYCKTKSLLLCIAAHGIFNSLSIFANEANITPLTSIITAVILATLTGTYALYLALFVGRDDDKSSSKEE